MTVASLSVWASLATPKASDGRLVQVVQGGGVDETARSLRQQTVNVGGSLGDGDEARQPALVDGEKADGVVVKWTVCNKNGSRQSVF